MKPIRVACIILDMNAGGAQKIVLNYLRDFQNQKDLIFKVFVCSDKSDYLYHKIIPKENLKVEYIVVKESNRLLRRLMSFLTLRFKLWKSLKVFKPDIIHLQESRVLSQALLPSLMVLPTNILLTLHSDPRLNKGLNLFLARIAFQILKVIPICLNYRQLELAQKRYYIRNCEIIHNGVDFEKIKKNIISKEDARGKYGIDKNTFVICACGRLHKVKNYPLMLDIFKKLLEQNNNAVLLIAGDGPEKESIIKYAEKLRIADKVKFLGNLDNVVTLYCASDVFLLTSHSESMSLVLMEAQTCSCKCVVSAGVPKESIITDKVVSMKENASIEEWVNAILTENVTYEKPRFSETDYEVHNISKLLKEIYFFYLNHTESI